MATPLKITAVSMEYAQRLFAAADSIQADLGMTGGQVVEGAALFAGIVARANAKPGEGPTVAAAAAQIVEQIGADRIVN